MIELRYLEKEKGERVLQYRHVRTAISPMPSSPDEWPNVGMIADDWQDVPVVKEDIVTEFKNKITAELRTYRDIEKSHDNVDKYVNEILKAVYEDLKDNSFDEQDCGGWICVVDIERWAKKQGIIE